MSENSRLASELSRIRRSVAQRHGDESGRDHESESDARSPVDDAAAIAQVNAHWGITSNLPAVGGLLVLFRRVLRLSLRWYINPIIEQQNEFNQSVVRALYDLEARVESLEHAERLSDERDAE